MLEAKNICFGYTKDNVLKSISVNFEKGNLYTIAGANGCGKTTLLKAFARLIKPSGELLLDKKGYDKYERYEFAKKVAYLPQVRSTPSITVGQLVAHGRFPYLGFSRVMSAEDKAATEKEHLGSRFFDFKTGKATDRKQFVSARIDPETGALIVKPAAQGKFDSRALGPGVYHMFDLNFFYFDLQANGKRRINAFRK